MKKVEKTYYQPYNSTMDTNEKRITDGIQFAEFVWWSLAKRIVSLAGDLYKWDESQWDTAQELFLRSNDYKVVIKH